MAGYRYPNLTIIIDESELHIKDPNVFSPAVIAKLPLSAAVHSSEASFRMLSKGFVVVSTYTYTLTLMPWTPEYGSTAVPLQTQLNPDPINHHIANSSRVPPPNERLSIEISGIPPHLTIHRLFSGICTIRDITLKPATLTCWVSAYGQEPLVPSIAHIGVRKTTEHGDLLNIWPLWYETYTEEMLGRMTPPEHRWSQRRVSSDLATVHQEEHHREYFAYADISTDSSLNNSDDDEHGWESDRSWKFH
ncbi:unnamed protein product [Miscanthus lutarioriparius]|uniref:Uncharacterized protein n=1 Tax=Miscanthus lutarioriparius TaxID=422564 RepID=A0A811PGA2_9POAL|nr:unnamed protein product [Miscanthus lutarioriparius]